MKIKAINAASLAYLALFFNAKHETSSPDKKYDKVVLPT